MTAMIQGMRQRKYDSHYYNVLPMKRYTVICKWTWMSHKCIVQILWQPPINFLKNIIAMLKKERVQNNMKCSIKTKKARKRVEDKYRNKEQDNNRKSKRTNQKTDTITVN